MPAVLLLFALLACPSGSATAPNPEQLEILRAGIIALRDQISRQQQQRSTLRKRLEAIERDIDEMATGLRDSRHILSSQTEDQRFLTKRITGLERRITEQRDQILDIMRQLHRIGSSGQLRLLFSVDSPNRFVRLHHYHRHLGQLRKQRIERFRNSIELLVSTEQRSQRLAREMRQRRTQLQAQRSDLERHMAEHRATLNAVDADLRQLNTALERLVQEQQQLQQLLDGVQRQLPTHQTHIKSQQHQLPHPVEGTIVNHYGSPRASGVLRWRGIRISAPDGATVHAVHNGRVVFAHPFGDTGLLVILDHGGGYLSVYGHNQSLLAAIGDEVRTGEPIATVGRSGGQSDSGLYFELRHHGKPLNPMLWLKPG